MAEEDNIKLSSKHLQDFKKAIDSLGELGDLFCESRLHRLKDKKREVIQNLQPIKQDLGRFLKAKGFEITYIDPIIEQGYYQRKEMEETFKEKYKAQKALLLYTAKLNGRTLPDVFFDESIGGTIKPDELAKIDELAKKIRTLEEFYNFIELELNDTIKYVTDPKNLTPKNQACFALNCDICKLRISCLINKLTEISKFVADSDETYRLALESGSEESAATEQLHKTTTGTAGDEKNGGQSVDSQNKQEDIIDVKPNFFGIGLNINALIRKIYCWIKNKKST